MTALDEILPAMKNTVSLLKLRETKDLGLIVKPILK